MSKGAGGILSACPLLFLLATLSIPAWSGRAEESLVRARAARLWDEPQWQRLLHVKAGRSDALGGGFFLSPGGRGDARTELEAEVSALYDVDPGTTGAHVLCRFPARSRWLMERLSIAPGEVFAADCSGYRQWRALMDASAVSLVFASAYMDNPSSMFGHTFLRLERSASGEDQRLLDNTLNFAAETGPDGGALFAVKGLAGLYPGRYTLKPYYMKIQEYNNVENRDLWEYRLALSSAEVDALAAHAWEMGQASFPYYFFSKNCSYQLMPALEAAAARLSLMPGSPAIVGPVDTLLAVTNSPGLVTQVRYRPSHATIMRQRRSLLTSGERRAAESFFQGRLAQGDAALASMPSARQALVLDCAQDYILYKKGFSPDVSDEVRVLERPILVRRAKVQEPPVDLPSPSWAVPPEQGHLRHRLIVGAGARKGGAFTELSWRPGYHDLLDRGRGFMPGAAIEGFTARLRYDHDEKRFYVRDARLVEILSVAPWDPWVRKPSWAVGTGLDTAFELGKRASDSFIYECHLGTGLAAEVLPGALAYAMVAGESAVGSALRDGWRLGGGLTGGIAAGLGGNVRIVLEGGLSGFPVGDKTPNHRLRLGINLAPSRDLAVRSEFLLRGPHREAGLYAVLYH